MIWAWRHQLHPASDLILTNLCIGLVIFCQGVASFPRSSGGDRILISHGPRLCHGSLSSCDISCHLVITCHHPDIRQPAAKLVCVLEKRGNCKPVTDCWLSKVIWPGDHRLIMRRIFQSIFELNITWKGTLCKNIFLVSEELEINNGGLITQSGLTLCSGSVPPLLGLTSWSGGTGGGIFKTNSSTN